MELFPLAEKELIKPVLAQFPKRNEQWPVFFRLPFLSHPVSGFEKRIPNVDLVELS